MSIAGDVEDNGVEMDHEFPYDLLGNDLEGKAKLLLFRRYFKSQVILFSY